MSTATASLVEELTPAQHLDKYLEELAQPCGQRNAIDGRIVEIVAELARDQLCGMTGEAGVSNLILWVSVQGRCQCTLSNT
ncbi:MAG: hypothetical protein SV966_17810 [Actinomycetota bacterium]|nr:hypothetical protein [Actinomycetota bacterium]